MASALDRLKAKHANAPAAPAATAPPVTTPAAPPAPPPVPQAPPPEPPAQPAQTAPVAATNPAMVSLLSSPAVAPAPQQAVQQSAPPPPPPPAAASLAALNPPTTVAAPAVESAPAATAPAPHADTSIVRAALPPMKVDAATAMLAVSALLGKQQVYAAAMSEGIDAAEDGPMISLKQPFARIKKGNWDVLKDKYDKLVYDGLPTGDRTYPALYLAHRIGGAGWEGEPGASGNKPPRFKFVIPNMQRDPAQPDNPSAVSVNPMLVDLVKATQFISSRILFTKKEERGKFDILGRLTPEIHVLIWRPDTGFAVLVTNGFKSVKYTKDKFDTTQMTVGVPYRFDIEKHTEKNPKGTVEKKNLEWDSFSITPVVNSEPTAMSQRGAFDAMFQRDPTGVFLEIMAFNEGSDFEGLNMEVLADKLEAYGQIIGRPVFGEES